MAKDTFFKEWPASTQVSATIYKGSTLTVVFRTGSIYQYAVVPAKVWENLQQATSIGTFLNKEIKGAYEFNQIV